MIVLFDQKNKGYKASRMQNKWRLLIMITILMIYTKNTEITLWCGTTETIQRTQDIREIIEHLNEEDLIRFGEHLNINENHFREQILNLPDNDLVNNNLNHGGFRWNSFILFVIGSAALFLITRYGRDMLELVYDLGTNTLPEIANRGIRGLMEFAINAGHSQQVREYLILQAQEGLNDPDSAARVVNAFRAVNQHI